MRAFWIAAAAMFAIDQVSKWGIVFGLNLRERGLIDVVPPFLRLRMGWNGGINFGLLSGQPLVSRFALIVLAVAVSVWLWRFAARDRRAIVRVAAGLLVGGALGNALDRAVHGAVADFINMSCCGITNPFAFNLADVGIFAGAIGLIIWAGREKTA